MCSWSVLHITTHCIFSPVPPPGEAESIMASEHDRLDLPLGTPTFDSIEKARRARNSLASLLEKWRAIWEEIRIVRSVHSPILLSPKNKTVTYHLPLLHNMTESMFCTNSLSWISHQISLSVKNYNRNNVGTVFVDDVKGASAAKLWLSTSPNKNEYLHRLLCVPTFTLWFHHIP